MWLAEFLRARMMNGDTVELFNRNSELFRSLHRFIKTHSTRPLPSTPMH